MSDPHLPACGPGRGRRSLVTLTNDLLLLAAGALASSVNAAAGGGTLLSFPALLGAGLSPLAANATSTVGLLPGSFGSVFGLRGELREHPRDAITIALPSMLGGVLGAILLLVLGGKAFAAAVPALLIGASGLLLVQPLVARMLKREGPPRDKPAAVLFGANLAVSIYGGYFGAGAGILFLGTMGLLLPHDLRRVNSLKILSNLLTNGIGAATFVIAEVALHPGALVWRAMLPLSLGSIVGGYFGVRLVRKLPAQFIRAFASAVGLAIAAYFIFLK